MPHFEHLSILTEYFNIKQKRLPKEPLKDMFSELIIASLLFQCE